MAQSKYSLRSIIHDLILVVRGSNISQSENIQPRQVEQWVNQYRSILLKQDLDKGKMPNSDYIQSIDNIKLELVDKRDSDNDVETDFFILRSTHKIPKTLDLNHKTGFTYIGTIFGDQFQLVPENRVNWQKHRRFSGKDPIAYLKDEYLYIHNHLLLENVNIRGIFEIPMEAINFQNSISGLLLNGLDSTYPMPSNTIPVMKEMILSKELGIITQAPSDKDNDSRNIVTGNAAGQPQKSA